MILNDDIYVIAGFHVDCRGPSRFLTTSQQTEATPSPVGGAGSGGSGGGQSRADRELDKKKRQQVTTGKLS